eukprot:399791_1
MRDLAVKLYNDEVIAVKIHDPSTVMDCLKMHNLKWCELIEEVKTAKKYFQIHQIDWANIALFLKGFSYIKKNEAPQRICLKRAGITKEQIIESTRFYDELNEHNTLRFIMGLRF